MDDFFRLHAFHLRPIEPGQVSEGFVFTPLDAGSKSIRVSLHKTSGSLQAVVDKIEPGEAADLAVDFAFTIAVPGIAADYLKHDFDALVPAASRRDCDLAALVEGLSKMPATTTNGEATRPGDPVNLVIIGEFATVLSAFVARWDESETITVATCWKTVRSFLLGSQYRYSPVSALHLFDRAQDVALQRSRRSINERLHLRLWMTPLRFDGLTVWVGQVSRDIGVRFTTRAWNLTTHRIDPDVDEARDYVIEDLLEAQRVEATGYVEGVGSCDPVSPRHNLTGDPYFTDGKRAVLLLSPTRNAPRFVAWK
jgi:hypothetical protein